MRKKALISGASGQDGAYLAQLLLENGYAVYGASRDAQTCSFANLRSIGIREHVRTLSIAVNDFRQRGIRCRNCSFRYYVYRRWSV